MQLVSDRSSSLASQPEMRLGAGDLLLFRIVLDAVEAEDQIDRLLRDRRRRQCVVKVAPQVRMAGSALALRDFRDDVVAAVAVDDQRALRAAEQALRRLAAATTGEDVGDVLIAVLVGGDKRPDEAVLRLDPVEAVKSAISGPLPALALTCVCPGMLMFGPGVEVRVNRCSIGAEMQFRFIRFSDVQADTGPLQSGFAHDGFTSVSIQLRAAYRF